MGPGKRWVGLSVAVTGAVMTIGGAVSVVANTFAAREHRSFTVSLGGLLAGMGCGVVVVGVLLAREWDGRRPTVVLCAAVILVATVAGYLTGGLLDNALR